MRGVVSSGLLIGLVLFCIASRGGAEAGTTTSITASPIEEIPSPPREFRGLWIATVSNIDWPSQRGLPVDQQKTELLALLDRAKQLHMNAVVFQVRPACDAMYKSDLEPWSEYLSGAQGQAPGEGFDPLGFAVEECHRRGLELHAWFNPYRAAMSKSTQFSAQHITKTRPELVKEYGDFLWLDPGEKEVQDLAMTVIMDVVRRYDIDAVHFDDYFYPYIVKDNAGRIVEFPDETTYAKYKTAGGTLQRGDWRRKNVDDFVQRVQAELKATKRPVRFGISPFGIWRPNHPVGVVGLDAYAELYADARKWLQEGYVDYLAPQLYWPLKSQGQPYAAILKWWCSQNTKQRHIWVGNYVSSVGKGETWTASEIVNQIDTTRRTAGASGNIHFSAKAIMTDKGGLAQSLAQNAYTGPALVPACPWLDSISPMAPKAAATRDSEGNILISWDVPSDTDVFLNAVYAYVDGHWRMDIVPASSRGYAFSKTSGGEPAKIAVSCIDRCGNESSRSILRLNSQMGSNTLARH